MKKEKLLKYLKKPKFLKEILLLSGSLVLIVFGLAAFWLATLKIPNLDSVTKRRITQSTKIYDRTGTVLLYDLHQDIKRSIVPSEEISRNVKNATVAIEDAEFYQHDGIQPSSILRAFISNIKKGCLTCSQGGSTITQQVVKNTLLTTERKLSRKLKEWVLAYKLEKVMTKENILALYLNESPYGGSIYGVEEASQSFFGKNAASVSIAEGAYLASLLKAPTYYSPYGLHKKELNDRHNLVLRKMYENKFISKDEYQQAVAEKVVFAEQEKKGIRAPHFVNYIIDQLVTKYGSDAVRGEGMKVTTTLDYDLEQKAEDIVLNFATSNEKNFNAENAALTAIDPKTGQILVMVGSRNYFDKEIQGNFNVTTALRQPGSSFKPIVYATAFEKGYQPETVLFDVQTEFSSECNPDGTPIKPEAKCYRPKNYDEKFKGPISLRDALAQSRNIPAIKLLYLTGTKESLKTARALGITSLTNPDQYGLTLVLGGGEVSQLELTSAYATFANKGIRNPYTGILRIEDHTGKVIEQFTPEPEQAIGQQAALKITDILSDEKARGENPNPFFRYPGRDVAAKTGTTNDFRDAWVMGYSANIAVGVWAGNNDNRPMEKKVAGFIAAPLWGAFMTEALQKYPDEKLEKPEPVDLSALKPILRGQWRGDTSYFVDSISGKLATEFTPPELRLEKSIGTIHSILKAIDKNDIFGPAPQYPENDSQFSHWEYGVRKYVTENAISENGTVPTEKDDVHLPAYAPVIQFINPIANAEYGKQDRVIVAINHRGMFQLTKVDYFINGTFIGESKSEPFTFSFTADDVSSIKDTNELRAVAYDTALNKGEASVQFRIK